MQTNAWGPSGWNFLFCIAANYPVKIIPGNKEHLKIKKHYIQFFKMIKDISPCRYCRQSYKQFISELRIEPYTGTRRKMLYWLYLIKDKVNKKLLEQEAKSDYTGKFRTKKSPPFEQVCKRYEKFRAHCSDKTKTCRKPKI